MHSHDGHQVRPVPGPDILVVCVGNDLAGDDGAGIAVYHQLVLEPLPGQVQVLLLGLGGMALLDHLHGQQLLIVVDAVQLNGHPGTVHVLDWDELSTVGRQAVSLHGIGFAETLSVARELYPESVPQRAVLIGIEGHRFNELGVPLSGEVETAVRKATEEVLRQILEVNGMELK
jgi:hydrogenase maturation protease